jgi:hypothetical protein
MHGVKAAPKGDKEGESDDVRYLGQVFYKWSSTIWEVNEAALVLFLLAWRAMYMWREEGMWESRAPWL